MAEVVRVVVDHEHLVRHGVAQPVDQIGLGQAGDPEEQLVGDRGVPGARRHGAQQLLDVGIERIDPGAEHLLELGRDLVEVVDRHRQLLHEERDATGPDGDLRRHGRVDLVTRQRGQQLGDLGLVERAEADRGHRADPVQLGERWTERVTPVQLVGAVGGHEEHALVDEVAGEEVEQVERGRVRPVQVLEHEGDRSLDRQAVQEAQHQLEQPAGARREDVGHDRIGHVVAELGQQASELTPRAADDRSQLGRSHPPDERAQRRHQRPERLDRAGLAGAPTDEPQPVGALDLVGQLAQQSRLADARLATDQDDRRRPVRRPRPGVQERQVLGVAADERRRGGKVTHGIDHVSDPFGAETGFAPLGTRGQTRNGDAPKGVPVAMRT